MGTAEETQVQRLPIVERPQDIYRYLSSLISGVRWEAAFYTLLLVAALALRLWDLGSRAFHHDESLHAFFSLDLIGAFEHNPLMHGPFQFTATNFIFNIFGEGDYTARLLPALFGTALVGMPYFLRDHLGRWGSMATAALLAFSPTMLYFSRFARNDIYMAVWTLGLAIVLWRYLESRKHRYLYMAAALLSLAFATKETIFITLLIFGSFLAIMRFKELIGLLQRRIKLSQISPPLVFLLLLVALSLPQWSAALSIFQGWIGLTLARPAAEYVNGPVGVPVGGAALALAIIIALLLMGVSFLVGLRWRPKTWLISAAIFYAIYVLLFTTFFTNIVGFGSGVWQSLGYWLAQQDVARGSQPWYYYLILLFTYEILPLIFALAALVYYLVRREKADSFTWFLIYWAGVGLLLYSIAGEKMPWLFVNVALPFILLAGKFMGRLVEEFRPRISLFPKGGLQLLIVAAIGLLLVFTVRTSVVAAYGIGREGKGDLPIEMLVYTQTSPDIPNVVAMIDAFAEETGQGKNLSITVDASDGFTWPWAWYLRDYKNVGYPDLGEIDAPPQNSVVLLNASNEGKAQPFLAAYDEEMRYRHRSWFPEYTTYKNGGEPLSVGDFFSKLGSAGSWRQWWDYFMSKELTDSNPIGSISGVAYFKKDP